MEDYKGYCCDNCGETKNYRIERMYKKALSENYDEQGWSYLVNINEGLIDKIYCYSCEIVSELINLKDEEEQD